MDPRERNTIFTYMFGFIVLVLAGMCSSQVQTQRMLSCKNLKDARKCDPKGGTRFLFVKAYFITTFLERYA